MTVVISPFVSPTWLGLWPLLIRRRPGLKHCGPGSLPARWTSWSGKLSTMSPSYRHRHLNLIHNRRPGFKLCWTLTGLARSPESRHKLNLFQRVLVVTMSRAEHNYNRRGCAIGSEVATANPLLIETEVDALFLHGRKMGIITLKAEPVDLGKLEFCVMRMRYWRMVAP